MRGLALALLLAAPALAQERPGDWGQPLPIPALPFAHAGTTVGRASKASRYAPKPQASEAGPEVAYRVTLPAAGRLVAWVEGDDGPRVDIDVHLLTALELDADGDAPRCVARGDVSVEADLPAGECFVVVDTYVTRTGVACPGPYRLRVELLPEGGWHERPLARGVTLRTRRYPDLRGARQQASLLVVDPRQEGVSVRPVEARGCQPTSDVGRAAGAVAAVNAGVFDAGTACRSVSLLKTKGELRATNAKDRSAFGVDAQGRPRFALVPAGRDWPEVTDAVGGVGRLLDAGDVVIAPGAEGSADSFATARHPRTLVGLRASGELVLATIDGRTAVGAGLTLAELAGWARDDLACQDALNLDGGGSTCVGARRPVERRRQRAQRRRAGRPRRRAAGRLGPRRLRPAARAAARVAPPPARHARRRRGLGRARRGRPRGRPGDVHLRGRDPRGPGRRDGAADLARRRRAGAGRRPRRRARGRGDAWDPLTGVGRKRSTRGAR